MVVMTSFSPPSEGLKHVEANTVAVVNNKELGSGTLYISESNLSWKNFDADTGFSLDYTHIALHAVSRDLTAYPKECLYVMVDKKLDDDDEAKDDSDESDEEGDSNCGMTEMRFIPDDNSSLDCMFTAMNYCQSLHPDPIQSLSEDEASEEGGGGGGDMEDGDDEHIGVGTNGCSNGVNGSPMETDGQFEDAES